MYNSLVSPFRVDIIYQGVNVGTPTTVLSLDDTQNLDKIGSLTFTIPTIDELSDYLVTGTYFEIYDSVDGFLGVFLFKSKSISENNGTSITTVHCYSVLKELTFETVGFNRSYENEPVSDVIQDLVSLYPGWTVLIENGLNNTTIDFQGESIYRAIDEQRDRNIAHFRLSGNSARELEFGYFGDVSDIVFTNLRGQHIPAFENNNTIALVNSLSITNESDEIFNRIIPLGFGQGVSQLTIEQATLGDYDIGIGTNQDGSSYYYIEDDLSSGNYGTRTRILSLPNIRPIDNNEQNIINASNALKLTAEAYLSKHLEPSTEYQIKVSAIRQPLKVGNIVRIVYKGLANNRKYVDVDGYFYVMDLTRNREVDGKRTFDITISSVDVRRTSDQDVIVDVVRDLRSLGVHIPASLSYYQNTYEKRIGGSTTEANRTNATFEFRFKEEILYLNRALLTFKTNALEINAVGVAAGGSSVETSSSNGSHRHKIADYTSSGVVIDGNVTNEYTFPTDSGAVGSILLAIQRISGSTDDIYTSQAADNHDHTINIPAHTHDLEYGLFDSGTFPQNIGVLLHLIHQH